MNVGMSSRHVAVRNRDTPGAASTRWVWLSLTPLGLGAWAPIYAGVRARRPSWSALGVLCTLIVIVGWVLAIVSNGNSGLGGGLLLLGWTGAIATSLTIRAPYSRLMGSPFEAAVLDAEDRLAQRDRARQLARERPGLAREIGIGRPDLPDAHDAGLVDVNNASAVVLEQLPGVDDALATRIIEARAQTNGFASVEDLGAALNLDGTLVEGLRERVVFLPR